MRKQLFLLCTFIVTSLSSGFAQLHHQFAGNQLMDYIGLERNQASLKAWIGTLGAADRNLSSEYTLTFPQHGIRLGFYKKKWLDKIMLYGEYTGKDAKSFRPYTGKLPMGVDFNDSRAMVMHKMRQTPYRDYANLSEYNHLKANLVFFFDGPRLQSRLTKVLIRYKSCLSGDCQDGEGVYEDLAGNHYEGSWKDGKQHGNGKMRFSDGTVKEGVWERGNYRGPNFFKAHRLYDLLGKHHSSTSLKRLRDSYVDTVREVPLSYDYVKNILDNGNIKLYFNDYGYLYKVDIHRNRIRDFADDLMSRLSASSDQRFVQYALGDPKYRKNERGRDIWYYDESPYILRIEFGRDKKIHDLEVKVADGELLFQDIAGRCMSGNCQNGFGESVGPSGRYIGEFRNGKFNGKGTFYHEQGGVYKGHFINNLRQGEGIYVWSDQSFYDGQWHHNQREGMGIMKYADGGKFIGTWKNNRRHGEGTMYYANGDRYEGAWKFGQPNGLGTMYQGNARHYGVWMDGHLRERR